MTPAQLLQSAQTDPVPPELLTPEATTLWLITPLFYKQNAALERSLLVCLLTPIFRPLPCLR